MGRFSSQRNGAPLFLTPPPHDGGANFPPGRIQLDVEPDFCCSLSRSEEEPDWPAESGQVTVQTCSGVRVAYCATPASGSGTFDRSSGRLFWHFCLMQRLVASGARPI